jgi:membrane protease YdiL (CAAX protease family)
VNRRIYYLIYSMLTMAVIITAIKLYYIYMKTAFFAGLPATLQLLLPPLGILFICALLAIVARLVKSPLGFSIRGQSGKSAFFTILFVAGNLPFTLGLLLIPLVPRFSTLRILWYRLRRGERIACLISFLLSIALTALLLILQPSSFPAYWLIGLAYPLLSELLFRGFLWDRAKGKFERGLALGPFYISGIVLITALLYLVWSVAFWVVIEGTDWLSLPWQILFGFVAGLFYGFARERTSAIYAPLLFHQLTRVHPFGWLVSLVLAVYLFFIPDKGSGDYQQKRILRFR